MNITDQLLIDAINIFDDFTRIDPDQLDRPRMLDEDYILDYCIICDSMLDRSDRLMILELNLNDELHEVHLIFSYDEDRRITHMTILADGNYSDLLTS